GGDAPQERPGPGRRRDVGDTPERPEENGLGLAPDGPAGERVAEFMQQDDAEQGEGLGDLPGGGRVVLAAWCADLPPGDDEPRPVQIDVDAGQPEDPERAGRGWVHSDSLPPREKP